MFEIQFSEKMSFQLLTKKLSLPKNVYLKEPTDFVKFEETLKALCEKSLSQDWDWTFKVGGKVHMKLKETDEGNIYFTKLKEQQIKIEKKEEEDITKTVADAMGKRVGRYSN